MTTKLPEAFGKYIDLEFVGEGGFGAVYRARDEDLVWLISLEVLRKDTSDMACIDV